MITLALETFQASQQYLDLLPGGGSYMPLNKRPCRKKRRHSGKDD